MKVECHVECESAPKLSDESVGWSCDDIEMVARNRRAAMEDWDDFFRILE